jgi:anti-sigma B factor antagonist
MVAVRRMEIAGVRVDHGSDGAMYLSGELDMASVDGFVEEAVTFLGPRGELVLDVSGLEFIDSTGIRGFLELARSIRPTPLVIRSPQPNIAKVFDIVNIEALGMRVLQESV